MSLHDQNPTLVAIANEYGNCLDNYAHPCLFTQVKTCSPYFQYREFDKDIPYKVTNQFAGCYSQVHEIDMVPSQLKADKVESYALEIPICRDEFEMQKCACDPDARLDLEGRALRRIVDQLWLGKEQRAFTTAFDPTNYTAGTNLTSLLGAEFNNTATPTNAFKFLKQKIDNTPASRRPTHAIMSRAVLSVLETEGGFLGINCCDVLTSASSIAAKLGLREICVSDAYIDTAGLGLPPALGPILGNSILLFHRDDRFDAPDCPTATFAFEAIYSPNGQALSVYRKDDNWNMGLHGGLRVKAGYSSKFVINYDLGCLLTDVIV